MRAISNVQYFFPLFFQKKKKKEGEKGKINLLREDCIGNLGPSGEAIKKTSDHACISKERTSSGKKVCQSG